MIEFVIIAEVSRSTTLSLSRRPHPNPNPNLAPDPMPTIRTPVFALNFRRPSPSSFVIMYHL